MSSNGQIAVFGVYGKATKALTNADKSPRKLIQRMNEIIDLVALEQVVTIGENFGVRLFSPLYLIRRTIIEELPSL